MRDHDTESPNGLVFRSVTKNHTIDHSQELRLAGTDSAHRAGGLAWVVGLYGLYGERVGITLYSLLPPRTGGFTLAAHF